MISIELDDKADSNWNYRLSNSLHGTLFQTKEYAAYVKDVSNWNPLFIKFISEKGEIVGQLLVSIYSLLKNKDQLRTFIGKITNRDKQIYRWAYGPAIFVHDYQNKIAENLHKFLISRKGIPSGFTHPLSGENFALDSPFKVKTWATFLIDLSKSKELLWNNLDKHSARKNIERSKRHEVHIREITKPDLTLLHDLRKDTINKKYEEDISKLEYHWDILHKIGWTGFLAFKGEIPIGGITISHFNGYIIESGISRSTKDFNEKFYSQDLLKWTIIEWGIEKNYKYFDLAGVNPNPTTPKEQGIFHYKKKWGGSIRKYVIMLPIRDQVPKSSGDNLLVTINVNIIPVKTLAKPTASAISPE